MRYIGSTLWLVPLAVHVGYILATHTHLPPEIGVEPETPGTSVIHFLVGWIAIIGAANLAFAFLHIRLPSFSNRMLGAPGQAYWLSTTERKEELIDRLRSICEAVLFGLNVFFLAVYQSVYQTNAMAPFVNISMAVLVFCFMLLPLLVVIIAMLITIRGLAFDAKDKIENP
ncbi:MAG: hypothetical protein GY847_16375 [Proteobacteria bacterium]|nr:hypothetical protein [Pseudomonadota bacterium]